MKPFDDILPEEQEPRHEELITLLQRAYRKPVIVPPAEEAQIIAQVRERLMKADHGNSLNGDLPVSQVGVLDSSPYKAVSPVRKPRRDRRIVRLIALLAAAMIAVVLLGTSLILSRPRLTVTGGAGGLPTLTLFSHAVQVGSAVTFKLEHFSHSASVALTHDIQEPIPINGGSSLITTNSEGAANVTLTVDTTWGPGFHLIVAEDVATRYTASATLQITGEGVTRPPHLLIDTSTINMGPAFVGVNTIQQLKLANSGGGSITWSASSNQPWLLVSPSQGIFSQKQTISLTGQRVSLKPGEYTGSITITSNVSPPQRIQVDMTVLPLPPNAAGPVIAVAPALLSFTATDGGPDPVAQALTISNPGSRPLNWSLALTPGSTCSWLSTVPNSGTVAAGAISTLHVIVKNRCLLPGVYLGTLKFTAAGALNRTQAVNVSLTIQPHCGLVSSAGYLAFTVVQGQSTPANQTLGLNAITSCVGTPISWTSSSTASWLTITPASGQLKGTANTFVHVRVNARSLVPGIYSDDIFFITGRSTLTVPVQLTVQAVPPQVTPILGAAPLSLNFSAIQGQPDPTGQVVTIINNGGSLLQWNTTVNCSGTCWLNAAPTGGIIAQGQTGQVTINVNTASLTPGIYVEQVTLNGIDSKGVPASGSPQTITISLVVQPPCSISPPSSSSLSFSAIAGDSTNPPSQTVMFMGIGSCAWPVVWNSSVAPTASWLALTGSTGSIKGTGQSGSIGVAANIAGLQPGTYSTQVTITASAASGGAAQGTPQSLSVTLTLMGETVSGNVVACPGSTPPSCVTPQSLPGATVTLLSGSNTVATTTADSSGNYSFSNIPLGNYTISVAGYDVSNIHYVGSATLTLSGNTSNFTIQAFPG